MEKGCLKTGYLMKKSVQKVWRIWWFILHEDQLTCHHKHDKSVLEETILLQGSSVVCPCFGEDDENIETTFKINTPEGDELYFQAAGKQDRDRWAHGIGAVIRSISSSTKVSSSQVQFKHFKVKANVSEVLGALQDPDAGVDLKNHMRSGTVYKNCFRGSDVVEWLLRWSIVRSRVDGTSMAQSLLKLGHIQEVDLEDGTVGVSQKFNDGEKLYRFTSLNLGAKGSESEDISDSDSSISEDEIDSISQEKFRKGKILKVGFILKRKSVRKGWRLVRVMIRSGPASLEYISASLLLRQPLEPPPSSIKILNLQNCSLVNSNKASPITSDSEPVLKSEMCRIKRKVYIRGPRKNCTFQAKDEEEWEELISMLTPLCTAKPTT